MDALAGGMGLFVLLMWGVAALVGLAAFGFWIWMIVDCAVRTFPGQNDKLIWMLILILSNILAGAGWIAAIVYYFMVKRPADSGGRPHSF